MKLELIIKTVQFLLASEASAMSNTGEWITTQYSADWFESFKASANQPNLMPPIVYTAERFDPTTRNVVTQQPNNSGNLQSSRLYHGESFTSLIVLLEDLHIQCFQNRLSYRVQHAVEQWWVKWHTELARKLTAMLVHSTHVFHTARTRWKMRITVAQSAERFWAFTRRNNLFRSIFAKQLKKCLN